MRQYALLVITILMFLPQYVFAQEPEFEDEPIEIEEIVVRAQRKRYNRDSPAVRLAKQLIERRDEFNPYVALDYLQYQRYEKVVISLNNYKTIDSTRTLSFLNQSATTNPYTGKTILPLSLKESVIESKRGKSVEKKSDEVLFSESFGLDDRFSQTTILAFIQESMPEVNLFSNYVYLAGRQIISPLNREAYNFYKFFLHTDTLDYNGRRCVELEFYPFSKNSLGFRGKFIVNVDSTSVGAPYIELAEVSMPNTTDVNFLSNMTQIQTFRRDTLGVLLLQSDELSLDASPLKKRSFVNVQRSNVYSEYDFSQQDDSNGVVDPEIIAKVEHDMEDVVLSEEQKNVLNLAQQMRRKPLWVILEETLLILTEGYFQTGRKSYFDVGPVPQFLTGNSIEGTRLALGGYTTPNLFKHFFVDGIVAYGFRDEKWKGGVSFEWSFVPKDVTYKEFPVHSLRATFSYDTHNFSDGFDELNSQNVYSWAQRSGNAKLTYVRLYQLRYQREWANNMSLKLYGRHYTNYESADISFAPTAGILPRYDMSEFEFRFRYAPGEKIYQTRRSRRNLNKYIPTFEISHITSTKGFLGSDYSRNLTTLEGFGRINVQPLGYIDLYGKLGVEWSTVPYMLLPHPSTNLTYFMGRNSEFSLMLPLEYVYDRYVYIGFDYHLDGLLLSRLPLIKHLDLREVLTFRGLYGSLSDKNNPALNPDQLPLPQGAQPIEKTPYLEVGVGIDNIFSLFRVDYVWRITYLDKPNVSRGALLVNFELKF